MNKLQIYCDGSANPNPGPCGYAIIALKESLKFLEVFQFLGEGTNQIAEMIGLRESLRLAGDREAIIYTDSEWVINICTEKWKAKYYQQTWKQIKALMKKNHQLVWVKAHDKNKYNEEADKLAKEAVISKTSLWRFVGESKKEEDEKAETFWKDHLNKEAEMKKIRKSRNEAQKGEKGGNGYFKGKGKFVYNKSAFPPKKANKPIHKQSR